jgi:lipid-A-disaccharide synthase
MPNILADREVVPEFLQHEARPHPIAEAVLQLMDDPVRREKMITEFDVIIASLGETGASEKAARAILSELGQAPHDDRAQ